MENTKKTFRPILFSTPMVQAILENRKTMTRRTKGLEDVSSRVTIFEKSTGWLKQGNWIGKKQIATNPEMFEVLNVIKCPYEVGDVLWVRETFYQTTAPELNGAFYYKASIAEGWNLKWKPSIFMPKQACRIFLKIKSIRVERLQDISEDDCKNEGVKLNISQNGQILFELGSENNALSFLDNDSKKWNFPAIWKAHWAELWCKINGRDSWNHNPFVWVYEFEQIEKPLDFIL